MGTAVFQRSHENRAKVQRTTRKEQKMLRQLPKQIAGVALGLIIALTATPASAVTAGTYSADITISGLETFNLAGFSLNVNYDDSLLAFDSYTLTDELGSFDNFDAEDWSLGDDGFGTVALDVVSFLVDLGGQSDAFKLATVNFTGDEGAMAGISLSGILLGDDLGAPIPFTVNGTDINAVPVPAAVWLLGSGLVGIVGLRRRNRK
jgi:hypothetical protein